MKYLALLAIAAFLCISVLLSLHPEWFRFISQVPGRDKSVHFVVSGVLSFLIVTGFSGTAVRGRCVGPLLCLVLTAVLVTFEEFTQLAIPTRRFALLDLGWSYAGIVVFGLAAVILLRRFSAQS